jgi:carbon monoxide dehydrogenase subunit G
VVNGRESATELEVTEYVQNDRVRMVADQGGTIWDTVFVVKPTESGTELTLTMDAKAYKFAAKLINPLIKGMVKKFIVQDMEELKAYCESQ